MLSTIDSPVHVMLCTHAVLLHLECTLITASMAQIGVKWECKVCVYGEIEGIQKVLFKIISHTCVMLTQNVSLERTCTQKTTSMDSNRREK